MKYLLLYLLCLNTMIAQSNDNNDKIQALRGVKEAIDEVIVEQKKIKTEVANAKASNKSLSSVLGGNVNSIKTASSNNTKAIRGIKLDNLTKAQMKLKKMANTKKASSNNIKDNLIEAQMKLKKPTNTKKKKKKKKS